jgi:serine/threonine protein kinase
VSGTAVDAWERRQGDDGEALPPSSRRLPPGSRVDHYRIVRRIGRGGMGVVYLARDTKLGRRVALKMLRRRGTRLALRRLVGEARLTARFNHPNIVTIYAVGEHHEGPYLALEYVEGQSLARRLAEGRLGVPEALSIGIAVASALAEAHGHGVLHRDLKPANILLGRDGRVRVLDFGIAKLDEARVLRRASRPEQEGLRLPGPDATGAHPPRAELASSEAIGDVAAFSGLGTPSYMAPEQWREEACTPATDVWALGVVLYAMLAHELPFRAPSEIDLALAVCADEPTPLAGIRAVPAKLASLVHACLAKDPAARPCASAVLADLQRGLAAWWLEPVRAEAGLGRLLPAGALVVAALLVGILLGAQRDLPRRRCVEPGCLSPVQGSPAPVVR